MVMDFAKRMEKAENTSRFSKREDNRVTYRGGWRSRHVDSILYRRYMKRTRTERRTK